jgi:hypothetical protein
MNPTFQAPPEPPPEPRRRGAIVLTGVLLALWLGVTLGAHPLAPRIAAVAERVEIATGWDRVIPDTTPESDDP